MLFNATFFQVCRVALPPSPPALVGRWSPALNSYTPRGDPSNRCPRWIFLVIGHAMALQHGTSSTPGRELLPAAPVNQE